MNTVNSDYVKARVNLEALLFKNNDLVKGAGGIVRKDESLWLLAFQDIEARDLNRVLELFFVRHGQPDTSATIQGYHIVETMASSTKNDFKGFINYHWGDIPVAIVVLCGAAIGRLRAYVACCDQEHDVERVRESLRHEYGYTHLSEMFQESLGVENV